MTLDSALDWAWTIIFVLFTVGVAAIGLVLWWGIFYGLSRTLANYRMFGRGRLACFLRRQAFLGRERRRARRV